MAPVSSDASLEPFPLTKVASLMVEATKVSRWSPDWERRQAAEALYYSAASSPCCWVAQAFLARIERSRFVRNGQSRTCVGGSVLRWRCGRRRLSCLCLWRGPSSLPEGHDIARHPWNGSGVSWPSFSARRRLSWGPLMDDIDFWEKAWAFFMSAPVVILAIVVIALILVWSQAGRIDSNERWLEHAALIRTPDHHSNAELTPNPSSCRSPSGVAHAVSVSLWFWVASKRSSNNGSRRVAGDAGSVDVLIEAAARGLIPLW